MKVFEKLNQLGARYFELEMGNVPDVNNEFRVLADYITHFVIYYLQRGNFEEVEFIWNPTSTSFGLRLVLDGNVFELRFYIDEGIIAGSTIDTFFVNETYGILATMESLLTNEL